VDTWRALAARNNAEWCDLVARSQGLTGTRWAADAWTSPARTPPLYPDAVTLVPDPSVPDLLARIDATAGCSVKDSFASCDLRPHGFRVLFEAEWIVATGAVSPLPPTGSGWEQVRDVAGLAAWERAWRADDGPLGPFGADLLDDDRVAVLARRAGGGVVAGAIASRSERVVGISNFFAGPDADAAATGWSGCLALVAALFPGLAVVGYESGAALAAAIHHGFTPAGPLRVWRRDP
jgi:hypothetical protein